MHKTESSSPSIILPILVESFAINTSDVSTSTNSELFPIARPAIIGQRSFATMIERYHTRFLLIAFIPRPCLPTHHCQNYSSPETFASLSILSRILSQTLLSILFLVHPMYPSPRQLVTHVRRQNRAGRLLLTLH